jgi:hypothetical protein
MSTAFHIIIVVVLLLLSLWYIKRSTTPDAAALPTISSSQWRYFGSHDYEREHPGLGTKHLYRKDDIWANLYVYDLKRNDWKEGVVDPEFFTHFMSTIDEIKMQEASGLYNNVRFGEIGRVEIGGSIFLMVILNFIIDGKRLDSAIALTAHSGSLLKYRLSAPQPQAGPIQTISIEFIEQNLKDLDARAF